jgi:hypothetical protein
MALNFTGRDRPAAAGDVPPSGRTAVVVLSCFGAAGILAALVFATALRQHRPPEPLPPLVGTDHALTAAAPPPVAPPPPEHWIVHPAVAQPPPAPPQAPAPAKPQPRAPDAAAAKARMLAALRQVPHGTITLSVEDDAEAQAYARKLADLFHQAGWTVDQSSVFGPGSPRYGLAAAFGVSPADEAVREAFDAVGFQFAPPPPDAGIIRTPEIFVGKPYGAGR